VLLGSGDREKPLATVTADRFYTLFDYKTSKGAPSAQAILDSDLVPTSSSFSLGTNPPGCYLALDTNGEKVVTGAVSSGGYTYFSTNKPTPPASTSCVSNLGVAQTYRMPLFCGVADSIQLAGGGLPPSPVVGMVEVQVPPAYVQNGLTKKQVPFIIGGFNSQLSGLSVSKVPINVDPTRKRIYWYPNKEH
jgi:type IV pilus assembly protein PilY1